MRYCMMKSFVLKHALHLCIYSFEIWYTQRIFCNKIRHLSRLLCLDKARSIHLCQTFTPFSKKATQTEKLRKNFCAWNKQKNIFIYWYEIYVYRGSTHYMERRYCVGYVESTTSDYIYIYIYQSSIHNILICYCLLKPCTRALWNGRMWVVNHNLWHSNTSHLVTDYIHIHTYTNHVHPIATFLCYPKSRALHFSCCCPRSFRQHCHTIFSYFICLAPMLLSILLSPSTTTFLSMLRRNHEDRKKRNEIHGM